MIEPEVFSWTVYGFALYYWWMIFKAIRSGVAAENLFIHPSFMIVGVLSTIFTFVNFTQSVWGHILAQIQ